MIKQFTKVFGVSKKQSLTLKSALTQLKKSVSNEKRISDLVGELYEILDILEIRNWDLGVTLQANRAGTIARFASLLADFEMVQRRARPDSSTPGEQVG